MDERRRAAPAAIAAALIGVGLALYRPGGVPELRPGTRDAAPPAPALAATISWPAASSAAPRPAAASAAPDAAPGEPEASAAEEPARADPRDAWRDALADLPAAPGPGASAPRAASDDAAASARAAGEPRGEPADEGRASRLAPSDASTGEPRDGGEFRAPEDAENAPEKPRRRLLSSGPAEADEDDGARERAPVAVDAGRGGSRRGAAADKRGARAFPLFHPPVRPAGFSKARAARRRAAKPPLLSKLLGRGAVRPPPASLQPPDLSALKGKRPLLLPWGAPVPSRSFELDRVEALDPRRAGAASDRRATPHWDPGPLWHDGAARGVIADARWLWLWKKDARWWAAPEPDSAPLLHHQGLWWSKQRGVWFVLHEGQLWSWRRFSEWDSEGLLRLADGVSLVYSADFKKVAVLTPGEGAVLYDAVSGAELGEWLESELPHRRPRPPLGLRLPRGI